MNPSTSPSTPPTSIARSVPLADRIAVVFLLIVAGVGAVWWTLHSTQRAHALLDCEAREATAIAETRAISIADLDAIEATCRGAR